MTPLFDTPLFGTVLVANRGEIARRVFRTLRRLGIRSVAVYTEADATAPHAREADHAVRVPSYLDTAAVVGAAVASGAAAVHPGYGFLSENAAFARACGDAGVVFVGPDVPALEVMGDKIRAKAHVSAHGVPTVPGFSAAGLSPADIVDRAARTGYPLLVKPSAGGGGKGMTVAVDADALPEALATARRIAAAAFGDDTLLLERLLPRPRHIEVQVLADAHGTTVSLGERECTLQRRHQKVVEEAPSPVVDAATRACLGEAAVAAARSVGYRGAGTVEFLVAGDRLDEPFFIEMNTRLQVEHPVTELVTGIDLVEQQLRVAAGQPLDLPAITLDGHAIEARVYAETPARGYLPATGTVRWWRAGDARVDGAVETGSVVTPHYDPMIAKVIAHGPDRATALARLDAALAGTVVLGVDTNIADLRDLIADPAVQAGDLDTGLIDRRPVAAVPVPPAAALVAVARRATDAAAPAIDAVWGRVGPWRAGGGVAARPVHLEDDAGRVHAVDVGRRPDRGAGSDAGGAMPADPDAAAGAPVMATGRLDVVNGDPVVVEGEPGEWWVHADGTAHRLRVVSRRAHAERRRAAAHRVPGAAAPELVAPLPGTVVAVHVSDGDRVEAGARVLTVEAMKMEHTVTAPHAGVVRLRVATGARVARDALVAVVRPDADGSTRPAPPVSEASGPVSPVSGVSASEPPVSAASEPVPPVSDPSAASAASVPSPEEAHP